MADQKQSYPIIASGVWWKLRDQFRRSLPSTVDADYLSTVLDCEKKTAQNILPALRTMGLIDEKGKPTERGNHWRFDEDYPEVCRAIRDQLYPEALVNAVPDPAHNLDGVQRWFQRNGGVGDAAAKQMARVYQLLSEANPAKKPEQQGKEAPRKREAKTTRAVKAGSPASATPVRSPVAPVAEDAHQSAPAHTSDHSHIPKGKTTAAPSLHIDIQIHIASDATLEQIEKIFESMAKHLYGKASG